ncbi:MAG: sugar nucleotide-binding protein, partial [Nocardioidaceae bacterium]
RHLLDTGAAYGTYNVTNSGPAVSWATLAREVFRHCGRDERDVTPVGTYEYAADKELAARPTNSLLDLGKIESTGFVTEDALEALARYLKDNTP